MFGEVGDVECVVRWAMLNVVGGEVGDVECVVGWARLCGWRALEGQH